MVIPARSADRNLNRTANYVVLYVRNLQRQEDPRAEAFAKQTQPLASVTINGITYAQVYQLPRPYTQAVDAVFGDGVHLRGISQAQIGATLTITPSWDIQTSQPGQLMYFVHLLDSSGLRKAQAAVPIDGSRFATWQAGQ